MVLEAEEREPFGRIVTDITDAEGMIVERHELLRVPTIQRERFTSAWHGVPHLDRLPSTEQAFKVGIEHA